MRRSSDASASQIAWQFSPSPLEEAKILYEKVGARNKTLAIITTLRTTAPRAGTKKCPRALAMPMNTAAKHTSNM